MKFSITKAALLPRLKRAKDATPKKSSRPIMLHVHLCAKNIGVEIVGSDEEVTYKGRIEEGVEIEEEGEATVHAADLYNVVANLPSSDPIHFSLEGEEIIVRSGKKIEFRLVTLPAADYPDTQSFEGQTYPFPRSELMEMIDGTLFATSHDEARYYLVGVCFEWSNGVAAATDGHRLALCQQCTKLGASNALISRNLLSQMRDILAASAQEEATLKLGGKKVALLMASESLQGMEIEGSFPDVRQVIPKEEKLAWRWKVDRIALLDALKRIVLLSKGSDSRAVRLRFSDEGSVNISSQHQGRGSAKEDLACEVIASQEGGFEIGMDAGYLMEALSHVPEEKVEIGAVNYLSPLTIKPASGDGKALHIVMPMRI